jgi:urate oxidase
MQNMIFDFLKIYEIYSHKHFIKLLNATFLDTHNHLLDTHNHLDQYYPTPFLCRI